jgi:hypothetical protein
MWKGNGNTTTLFFMKEIKIVNEERRGQVNITVMEYLNSIFFHKFGPANKQHTYQSIHPRKQNLKYQISISNVHALWV